MERCDPAGGRGKGSRVGRGGRRRIWVGETLGEKRGEIGGVVAKRGSVTSAEGGVSGSERRTTLAAGGSAVLAAILQTIGILRVKGFVKHGVSFL